MLELYVIVVMVGIAGGLIVYKFAALSSEVRTLKSQVFDVAGRLDAHPHKRA